MSRRARWCGSVFNGQTHRSRQTANFILEIDHALAKMSDLTFGELQPIEQLEHDVGMESILHALDRSVLSMLIINARACYIERRGANPASQVHVRMITSAALIIGLSLLHEPTYTIELGVHDANRTML